MMETVKHQNEVLQLIVFLLAIIGVPCAIWKFLEDGRRQRATIADAPYQRYLDQALAHPRLSWPEDKIPDDEKYPWLVAIMLNALGAQITSGAKDDMRRGIKADLKIHLQYLKGEQFKSEGGWSLFPKKLENLFGEVMAEQSVRQ
jgi:hypothetical protein